MGEYLMSPAPSNPEGHYEDMPLVALHDDLLKEQNTDWQFSEEVKLSPTAGLDTMQRYVALRDSLHGEHWGMKDPRQCLFLPNWQKVLGERGRYLVVLRHWSASIQSLLKRSSQDLALGFGSPGSDGRFWREPGHAAQVWVAYNERLLAFLEVCPVRQRLVVTQQALMQGLALPAVVSEQFCISLAVDAPSPIKVGLVHDEVAQSVRAHLTNEQVERMNALWDKLLVFADQRAEQEVPRWVPDEYNSRDWWLARSVLASSPFEAATESCNKVTYGAEVNAVSPAEPSFNVLSARAQAEYRLLQLAEAEQHTREAIALNPDETSSYVRLACIFLVAGQAHAADTVLVSALERLGEVAILLHYRATVLDLLGRTDEAVALLESASVPAEILERHRVAYQLKSGQAEGRQTFTTWVRQRAATPEAWQTVCRALASVEQETLRKDLALRVAQLWNRYA